MIELHRVKTMANRLVLLTMEDIKNDKPLMAANFKDDVALRHKTYKTWIGISPTNEIRLGIEPEMIDGIWYIKDGHFNIIDTEVNISNLVLDFIE